MRFLLKSAFVFFFILILVSCSSQVQTVSTLPQPAVQADNNIIAEFGNEKITVEEFEDAFNKVGIAKQATKADTLAEKKKFLDLYVNYKMKLRDALQKGVDKDPEVIKEFEEYKKSISSTMFLEKEVFSKGTKKLYDRRKYEIRLSQIYLKPDSTKTDLGQSKAVEILNKALAGENFDSLVQKYSEDPATKLKGGDLSYITAGEINIPDVEDVIYSTEPGKVCSKVVRTSIGFHILKVTEKNLRFAGINTSHIMAAYVPTPEAKPDTAAAMEKIQNALKELKAGVPFDSVAKKYSDDKSSSVKGGVLKTFTRREIIPEFFNAAIKLKPGEISDIVTTPFGFHIIKLNSIKPYPSYSEQLEELRNLYKQTSLNADMQAYTDQLKREYSYDFNKNFVTGIISVTDSCNVGDSLFTALIADKFKDSTFALINNKWIKGETLFTYLTSSNEFNGRNFTPDLFKKAFDQYSSNLLVEEKASVEMQKDPDFIKVMDDYKSGILLFKMNEKEIWNHVKLDTMQGKVYWKKNKDKYTTKPKVSYKEIYVRNEALKDSIYKALKEGGDFNAMAKRSLKPYSENARTEDAEANPLSKVAFLLKNKGDISEPFSNYNGWSIIQLESKEEKRVKSFEEAWPEVSSALQEIESKRLEDEYINRLKTVFQPKIFSEKIN